MKSRLQKHETKVSPERKKGQPSEVEELQAEIARLQKELRHEKLRADAYDKMIDQAETAFKIPIRKKSGAGQ